MTNLTNTTSLLGLAQNVNEQVMFNMLGNLFLIIIASIAVMAFYQATGSIGKAIAGSGYLIFIFSMILFALELVPALTVYICLITLAGSLAFTWKSD